MNHGQSKHTHQAAPQTQGAVLHWAKWYDRLAIWQILTLGKGVRLWDEMLDLAGLRAGQRVLDIGCGPGALTLKAKARVGQAGQAAGIDASPEMIKVAQEKAQHAGVQVDYRNEVVEKLPFADQSFDAVLSSLMMHHLPDDVKRQGLAEVRRVLKPGGVLVILDFKRRESIISRLSLPGMLHHSVSVGIQDLEAFLAEAGFDRIEGSETQIKMFGYLRGFKK